MSALALLLALASLRAHTTLWTTATMDADEDGRCRRRMDAGAADKGAGTGGGGLAD
ncbi:hypothetical protein [Oryza sativa Japonica Group]|uniref:Uncharacterized protein n=1 Tax=Oryza sativa subsp. japonica TaxID=39947 RepID=Q5N7D2_ORYSJ|nr:hypothetical protein [Oryza sativa Japonica Group]BAD82626.1 hypothetical protein [Oryza sativa Japonica Group]